ncbi:SelL-related redox protein [Planctomicrobium sp. SH661]|uniref:SelL-related redox protein n=1 Tax=Planctomicrobium sp. SH661 TaxID=3448124 RepID=UPI003F5C7648
MATTTPGWMRVSLLLAAAYNLAWGTWVILWPNSSLAICGYPEPIPYPQLWQCLGMVVGVYGIGYAIASTNPARHWPIVLVGLLGKVFGPLGFLISYLQGTLPLSAGRVCVFNDLIWWLPFALILRHAWGKNVIEGDREASGPTFDEVVRTVRSNTGQTLLELSSEKPLMVVFLRHAGCTFCREALSDIAKARAGIEAGGTGLAFVHMSSEETGEKLFQPYALDDLPRFSDPDQKLYRAFELGIGSFNQLLGPKVFLKGVQAALFRGHGFGLLDGNGLRMPGVFILKHGRIVTANRHQTAAERPDYQKLACPRD